MPVLLVRPTLELGAVPAGLLWAAGEREVVLASVGTAFELGQDGPEREQEPTVEPSAVAHS